MAVSNLHQGVIAGAAQPTGATFDPNLILNSIYLHGSGTSGDAMTRTSRTPGNRNRWLFGTWYQPLRVPLASGDRITIFAAGASSAGFYLSHEEDGDIRLFHRDESGNEGAVVTTEFYRDVTSWIHILVDYDSANANSADRLTMYVNGEKVGVNSGTRPAQNKSIMVNTEGEIERIGHDLSTTPNYHGAMYLAQTFLMDNKSIVNGDHATTDFLDTFAFGTHGSQIIPKSNDDIKTLVAAAGVNSFFLNYEDTTDKGSVDGMTRDRKATESTNHVLGITPTLTESIQGGATANVTNGQRSRGALETTTTTLTLLFDLGSGNEQAVQSVSFTTEGTTSFANDAGQGGGSQSNGRIKDLTISGSNNGTDFTTLSSSTVAQKRSNALHVVSWSNTTAYRYLKFANANIHGGLRSNVGGMGFHTEQSPVIGNDFWGDKNHSTSSGASEINQDHQKRHSPSKVYPVLNPLSATDNADMTIEDGNLVVTPTTDQRTLFASKGLTSGAWYFEVKVTAYTTGGGHYLGVANVGHAHDNNYQSYSPITSAIAVLTYSGSYNDHDGATDTTSLTGTNVFAANDIIGIAVDIDNGKFWYAKNNTWADGVTPAVNGSGASSLSWKVGSGPWFPFISRGGSYSDKHEFRFESGDFSYTPPDGFKEINSAEFTAPDFQGIDYFDSTIYEGTGDNQRVGDFVPFTDTFAIGNSAMWYSEDIRRLRHTYSSEAAATSDNSSDSAVYRKATISFWTKFIETNDSDQQVFLATSNSGQTERFMMYAHGTDDDVNIIIDPSGSDNNRAFKFAKGLLSTQAWSNVVIHIDTNNGTAADRIKVWINGNSVTSTETSRPYTAMTQGQNPFLFEDEQLMIGHLPPSDTYNSVYNFNSYLAEFHVIDGYNKAISDFGQVDTSTNRWVAKDYKTNVGTYGNRGFYLKFDGTPGASAGSNMGKDSSGNNIHLTEETHGSGSAWAAADKTDDTPSNNKAILWKSASVATISEGGLKIAATGNAYQWGLSSFAIPSSGKWVFEAQSSNIDGSSLYGYIGIAQRGGVAGSTNTGNNYLYALNLGNGEVVRNSSTVVDLGAGATTSVMRIEYDAGIDQIKIYDDNSLVHTATTHLSGHASLHFVVAPYGSGADFTVKFTDFTHTPTTDFKALIQDNLDDTASKLTAWAWIKNRDATDSHILVDRVRGIQKTMHSDVADAETTEEDTVMRFLQRGVQIGSDVQVNTSGESYVLWQWLLGSSATTGSTTSPAGSIASTSIVADAGHFSIISYTGNATAGATIGHGLSAAPEMIWIKERDNSNGWIVGNGTVGYGNIVRLDTEDALTADSGAFNSTAPSATLITLGSNNGTNRSTGAMICYAFRSVPGVCDIGSYEGNGSADGTYIHTGFKPRWIIIKNIDVARDWTVADTARHPANVVGEFLYASTNAVESARGVTSGTDYDLDILSDGFKIRTVDGALNSSTLIYMAMAEIGGNGTLPPIYGR